MPASLRRVQIVREDGSPGTLTVIYRYDHGGTLVLIERFLNGERVTRHYDGSLTVLSTGERLELEPGQADV